jgi:hypothetical protein
MIRTRKVALIALGGAAVAAVPGGARADRWDNPYVPAPVVNNGITVDGNFGEWGTAGTNYTAFGPWNQWWDNSYDGETHPTAKNGSVTTSRMAIDTANNRLVIGVQTTEPASFIEVNGLWGGIINSIEGQNTRRDGAHPNSDGTQLFVDVGPSTGGATAALTVGGNEVWRNGTQLANSSANTAGAVAAYQSDGTTWNIELSIPVKKDWTSADASASNTYNLNDLAGLVGGSGGGADNLNIAYNVSDFYEATGFNGGDGQGARFNDATNDGTAATVGPIYGNSKLFQDFWANRAVNSAGTGVNSQPNDLGAGGGKGGLTLVGETLPIPEPSSLALLALGAAGLVLRRRGVRRH